MFSFLKMIDKSTKRIQVPYQSTTWYTLYVTYYCIICDLHHIFFLSIVNKTSIQSNYIITLSFFLQIKITDRINSLNWWQELPVSVQTVLHVWRLWQLFLTRCLGERRDNHNQRVYTCSGTFQMCRSHSVSPSLHLADSALSKHHFQSGPS